MKKFTLFLVAMTMSLFSFAQSQMSGTYTVGTGGTYDYASMADAGMAIKSAEFTGDVTLLICTDLTETINTGIVNKSEYTLTIRPDKDENRTITYTTATDNTGPTGVFVIGGDMTKTPGSTIGWASVPTKNVIVDGAAEGKTTPRLKITTGKFGTGFLIYGDVQDCVVKNCILENTGTASANYALTFRSENYSKTSKNIGPKNCVVENCILEATHATKSQTVYFNGSQASSAAGYPANITIRNCNIKAHTRGMFLYGVNGLNVEGCTFNLSDMASGLMCHGIFGNKVAGTINVKGNKFIKNSTKNTYAGEFGLQTITASGGATIWVIENNYFAGFDALASGTTSKESRLVGIRCGDPCEVRHNTFYMPKLTYAPGAALVGTQPTTLLWLAGTHKYPVQNNIFVCEETTANVSLIRGGLNENVTGNVFYHKGGNAAIVAAAPSCMTFANLETSYPTQAATSKWTNVTFADAANGDLSLAGSSDGDLNLAVDRLAEVLTDINGTARREKTYAGAYEGSEFPAEVCNVTATVAPVGSGTVEGVGDYAIGSSITLTATPAAHYDFESWTGDVTSTDNPLTLTVSSNITVTANFQEHAKCTITAVANDDNMGTVTGGNIYYVGESVTLKATAKTGYVFAGWTDGEKNATRTITVSGDATYTANFQAIAPRAWAYDLKVREEGDNYKFTFNATTAGTATLLFADIDGNELVAAHAVGTVAAGANTVTLAKTTFEGVTKDVYWSVKMDGEAIPAISEITDQSRGIYDFYNMMGVVVDNDPNSDYFGKIYIQQSFEYTSGTTADRNKTQKAGIFIYDQGLNELNPTNVGYKPTMPTGYTAIGKSRESFKRLAINPTNGNLVFGNNISGEGSVWTIGRDNLTAEATNIIEGVTGIDKVNAICYDENGSLYVLANITTGSAKYNLYKFTAGVQTELTLGGAKVFVDADVAMTSDGRGGLWIAQRRGGITQYSILSHVNVAEDKVDFVLDSSADYATWFSGNCYRAAIAYNAAESIVAVQGASKILLFKVSYDASTGAPSIDKYLQVSPVGTSVDGLAFDYAGDLYTVNSGSEKFQKFTLPTDENICTVPAPASQKLVLGTQCEVTVTVNDPTMGSVEGAGQYEKGAEVTLTATPNEHYEFVNWTNGTDELSKENPYSFTVQEDVTIIANFAELPKYTITVNVNDNTMGSVTGGGTVYVGESVTLTATPNSGYAFVKWDDGITEATRTVLVEGDKTYTAIFQAMIPRAWAYDLRMIEDGDNYKFTFKATSTGTATLLFTNKAGTPVAPTSYAVGNVEAGEKSVTIAKSEFGGTEDIYWSVQMDGAAIENMVELTDPTKGIYNFYVPQGVAVDNSPNSMYFGRIYVAEGTTGANDGGSEMAKQMTAGLFVYNQALEKVQPATGYTGIIPQNVTFNTNKPTSNDEINIIRQQMHRIAVDPITSEVAFAYYKSDASPATAVYAMNPDDLQGDATNLIEGASVTKVNSLCYDEQGALYVMDNANTGLTGGQIYKVQNGEVTLFAAHDKNNQWAVYDNAMASDGRGGIWIAQNRYGYDYPILSHVNKYGVVDFAVKENLNSWFPNNNTGSSYRGQLAYNLSENILAFAGNKMVTLFTVEYDGDGKPTINKLMSTPLLGGGNIDGVAFDYAGDLYVASASAERLYKFVVPTNTNTCTVPAPKSEVIKKEARYTVTVVANPAEMGTVTEGGEYKAGEIVTLTATANKGYQFVNWTIGSDVISTDASLIYTVTAENVTITAYFEVEPLAIKGIVKRAVQIGENTVVLTHEADGTPHLYKYKVVDGTLEAELSQEGVEPAAAGYLSISDIAATEDGKLVACNYVHCKYDDAGNTSYFYIWDNLVGNPSVWFTSKKSTNYSNASMGYTMAVKGTSTDAVVTITGFNQNSGTNDVRFSHHTISGGVYTESATTYKYLKGRANTTNYATVGTTYELNASPFAAANWIIDGENITPTELDNSAVSAGEVTINASLDETLLGKKFNGATYLTIEGKHLMVAPYADGENVAGVTVLDITNGLDLATGLDYAELTSPVAATAAATAVKVNGKELTITLVVDAKVHIFTISLDIPKYTRTVILGHYGTICLPNASSSYTGAEFYEVSWIKMNGTTPQTLYLDQLAADAQLEAGRPYIFRATSTELTVTYTGEAVSAPIDPTETNGLTGSFDPIPAGSLTGKYVIAQDKFWTATETAYAAENRAYIEPTLVPTSEQEKISGRRRVALGTSGENAESGFEDIIAPEGQVLKVIENGQLIIIRDGVKYNVQGVRL